MNETQVTVVGNVATEPKLRVTAGGARVTNFRVASTERRFNKAANVWRDGDTAFFNVSCWRAAAENVADSIHKGDPVLVHGRLRISSYEKDGMTRSNFEIDAHAVGHDLFRGVSSFTKVVTGNAREGAAESQPAVSLSSLPTGLDTTPGPDPDDDPESDTFVA